jgi:hypothetical protein
MKIDLNADLGESFGAWAMGADAELLGIVSSANVACGFHAGDPLVMRRTLRLARERGVGVGAHVAYPDLQGFGRRPDAHPGRGTGGDAGLPDRRARRSGRRRRPAPRPPQAARRAQQRRLRRPRRWRARSAAPIKPTSTAP